MDNSSIVFNVHSRRLLHESFNALFFLTSTADSVRKTASISYIAHIIVDGVSVPCSKFMQNIFEFQIDQKNEATEILRCLLKALRKCSKYFLNEKLPSPVKGLPICSSL